jgi:hypothetical protein
LAETRISTGFLNWNRKKITSEMFLKCMSAGGKMFRELRNFAFQAIT